MVPRDQLLLDRYLWLGLRTSFIDLIGIYDARSVKADLEVLRSCFYGKRSGRISNLQPHARTHIYWVFGDVLAVFFFSRLFPCGDDFRVG